MKNDSINVNTLNLREAGNNIAAKKQEMDEYYNGIMDTVHGLDDIWDSSICSDFLRRVDKTREIFDAYGAMLTTFSEFLKDAAEKYEEVEKNNAKAASSFLN